VLEKSILRSFRRAVSEPEEIARCVVFLASDDAASSRLHAVGERRTDHDMSGRITNGEWRTGKRRRPPAIRYSPFAPRYSVEAFQVRDRARAGRSPSRRAGRTHPVLRHARFRHKTRSCARRPRRSLPRYPELADRDQRVPTPTSGAGARRAGKAVDNSAAIAIQFRITASSEFLGDNAGRRDGSAQISGSQPAGRVIRLGRGRAGPPVSTSAYNDIRAASSRI